MIQLVRKPGPGWGVLAAGALVASLLAAGAAPAAAVTDRADHATRLSACAGDAAADRMFSDVSQGHAFRSAINCIAYYGITRGTGDGATYSPERDVTRAQMAVFIARAAGVAGVDLAAAGDDRFDDIDDTWAEAADAINRLASAGIIPSGGAYRPDDAVTRAEMAVFLIGLLLEAAPHVTRDSSGTILLGSAGSRSAADDRFPDADGAEAAALYELGVTTGAGAADVQDDAEPPLDFNYEPTGTVDRGQMAAFITRALAHTPARPAGVSAQYDGADVVVSVRDARYRPVPGAVVDVFWAPAGSAGRALTAGGGCDLAVVNKADRSSYPCEIDVTDPVTGADGEARVAVTGLRRVPDGGATVWVWTGADGDVLDAGADPQRLEVAEGADLGFASATLVTTSFTARRARFGSSVQYTVQLRDTIGDVSTGADGADPARWRLSVQVPGEDPEVETLVSDNSGKATFSIRVDDPGNGSDVTATYTLSAARNAPPEYATVGADGQGAATGTVTFSAGAPTIAAGSATVTIDTRDYVHVAGRSTGNSATVTVFDQYGRPFPGTRVSLSSSISGVSPNGGAVCTVNSRGSCRFTYQYRGNGGQAETLTARYGPTGADIAGPAATVYWTADAGASDGGTAQAVVAGDAGRRHIVVNAAAPVLLVYDGNDRFDLDGRPTSMAAFEAELAAALRRESPGVSLEWSNYSPFSPDRIAEYDLTTG